MSGFWEKRWAVKPFIHCGVLNENDSSIFRQVLVQDRNVIIREAKGAGIVFIFFVFFHLPVPHGISDGDDSKKKREVAELGFWKEMLPEKEPRKQQCIRNKSYSQERERP